MFGIQGRRHQRKYSICAEGNRSQFRFCMWHPTWFGTNIHDCSDRIWMWSKQTRLCPRGCVPPPYGGGTHPRSSWLGLACMPICQSMNCVLLWDNYLLEAIASLQNSSKFNALWVPPPKEPFLLLRNSQGNGAFLALDICQARSMDLIASQEQLSLSGRREGLQIFWFDFKRGTTSIVQLEPVGIPSSEIKMKTPNPWTMVPVRVSDVP